MAPRTRRKKSSKQPKQQDTTTAVAPAINVSVQPVSTGGGGVQQSETDQYKLPPIVIRRPHMPVAERRTQTGSL